MFNLVLISILWNVVIVAHLVYLSLYIKKCRKQYRQFLVKLCNFHDFNITEQYFAHLHKNTWNCGYNYWDVSIMAELWYQQKWVVRLHLFFHHIRCSTESYVHWKYAHIMEAVVQLIIVDIAPDMGRLISNWQVEVAVVLTNQMPELCGVPHTNYELKCILDGLMLPIVKLWTVLQYILCKYTCCKKT